MNDFNIIDDYAEAFEYEDGSKQFDYEHLLIDGLQASWMQLVYRMNMLHTFGYKGGVNESNVFCISQIFDKEAGAKIAINFDCRNLMYRITAGMFVGGEDNEIKVVGYASFETLNKFVQTGEIHIGKDGILCI